MRIAYYDSKSEKELEIEHKNDTTIYETLSKNKSIYYKAYADN